MLEKFRGFMKRFKVANTKTMVVVNEDETPRYELISDQLDPEVAEKFREAKEMEKGADAQMEAITRIYAKMSILRQQAWELLYEKHGLDPEGNYQVNHKDGTIKKQVN